jgi:ribonucleoside-diphosphate reductase alpha chain
MSLQYGVPLEDYVRKFSHMRFEPQGYTKNPDIRIAKSLIDYIFRWMGNTFLPGYKEASQGVLPSAEASGGSATDDDADGGSAPGAKARVQGSGFGVQEKKSRPKAGDKPGLKAEGGKASTSSAQGKKTDGGATATLADPTPDAGHRSKEGHPTAKPSNGHSNGNGNGHANGNGNGHANGSGGDISAALLARAGVMLKDNGPNTARSEQFADFQSDAPACDNCGSITVRAGNCYLCHNCGSSMGCS